MKIAALADVKAHLSADVDACAREGLVIITRNGRVSAVLLPPKNDDDLERLMLGRSRRLRFLLAKSRRSIKAGKGVSHDEFWKTAARRHQTKCLRQSEKKPNLDSSGFVLSSPGRSEVVFHISAIPEMWKCGLIGLENVGLCQSRSAPPGALALANKRSGGETC